jgi:hypothetical protein
MGYFIADSDLDFHKWIYVEQDQECAICRCGTEWASQLDCGGIPESIGSRKSGRWWNV